MHLRWASVVPLRVGDVVEVTVVEADKADRPRSRKRAEARPAKPRRRA